MNSLKWTSMVAMVAQLAKGDDASTDPDCVFFTEQTQYKDTLANNKEYSAIWIGGALNTGTVRASWIPNPDILTSYPSVHTIDRTGCKDKCNSSADCKYWGFVYGPPQLCYLFNELDAPILSALQDVQQVTEGTTASWNAFGVRCKSGMLYTDSPEGKERAGDTTTVAPPCQSLTSFLPASLSKDEHKPLNSPFVSDHNACAAVCRYLKDCKFWAWDHNGSGTGDCYTFDAWPDKVNDDIQNGKLVSKASSAYGVKCSGFATLYPPSPCTHDYSALQVKLDNVVETLGELNGLLN